MGRNSSSLVGSHNMSAIVFIELDRDSSGTSTTIIGSELGDIATKSIVEDYRSNQGTSSPFGNSISRTPERSSFSDNHTKRLARGNDTRAVRTKWERISWYTFSIGC